MSPVRLAISQQDWSLHRTGSRDEERLKQKIHEALKGSLPTIVADGSVITADPTTRRKVRVPLRALELPHIRYRRDGQTVGEAGEGNTPQKGQVLGRSAAPSGRGSTRGSREGEGEEFYEAELSLADIQEMVFADLGLPNLKPRRDGEIEQEVTTYDDVRQRRNPANLDLMRTALRNMERNARERGRAEIGGISPNDYMVRTSREEISREVSAVVILMADASGSMNDVKRYLTRAFSWWAVAFLRSRYRKVDLVFILHTTRAWETDEDRFFRRGESGGTACSSANQLCLELIESRHPPNRYNLYPIHFSDGENWGEEDNRMCVELVRRMLSLGVNQYAYVEVVPDHDHSAQQLWDAYQSSLSSPAFKQVRLTDRSAMLPALRAVFNVESAR